MRELRSGPKPIGPCRSFALLRLKTCYPESAVDVRHVPRVSKLLVSSIAFVGISAQGCLAPETPHEPPVGQRDQLARAYLAGKLNTWQQRLFLQDWKISVIVSPSRELRKGTLGNIHWDADQKTATIRVLDASEYRTPFRAALSDMEFTVVHELIHLELESLPRSDASRREEEHAVNHMADALLLLDRQDNSRKD